MRSLYRRHVAESGENQTRRAKTDQFLPYLLPKSRWLWGAIIQSKNRRWGHDPLFPLLVNPSKNVILSSGTKKTSGTCFEQSSAVTCEALLSLDRSITHSNRLAYITPQSSVRDCIYKLQAPPNLRLTVRALRGKRNMHGCHHLLSIRKLHTFSME